MNKCTKCGAELKTRLDEYGPINEPLCLSCWVNTINAMEDDHQEDQERLFDE